MNRLSRPYEIRIPSSSFRRGLAVRAWSVAAAILTLAALASGCGGGSSVTPTATGPVGPITAEDLPFLVLTAQDLPPGFETGEERFVLPEREEPGCLAMYRVELKSSRQTVVSWVVLWETAAIARESVFVTERGPFPGESSRERRDFPSDLGDVGRAWDLEDTSEDGELLKGHGLHLAVGAVDVRIQLVGVDGEGTSYEQALALARVQVERIRARSP